MIAASREHLLRELRAALDGGHDTLNIFRAQPPEQFATDEAKWSELLAEILGLKEKEEAYSSEASEDEENIKSLNLNIESTPGQ